jgi:hypothetical protein
MKATKRAKSVGKGDSEFLVVLRGLNLAADEKKRFERAIQRAVLAELATLDRAPSFQALTPGSEPAAAVRAMAIDWNKILGFFIDAVS